MDDASRVSRGKPVCDLLADTNDLRHRQATAAQPLGKRFAFDEFENDDQLPVEVEHVMDGGDVGVTELRGGSRFAQYVFTCLLRRGMTRACLERNEASQPRVFGEQYRAHSARSKRTHYAVRTVNVTCLHSR